MIPARCPSHNAFKCTGECGFDGCNTHFMEKDALQEHINRGREKKISLTSSCAQVSRTQCLVFVLLLLLLLLLLFYFILIYKMYSSPNSIYQFNHCSLFISTGVFFPKGNQTRRRSTQIFLKKSTKVEIQCRSTHKNFVFNTPHFMGTFCNNFTVVFTHNTLF